MKSIALKLIAVAISFLTFYNATGQESMLCMGGHWTEDEANLMKKKKLIQEQLDSKLAKFGDLEHIIVPPNGWIFSIRQGLNMSLRQLGERLSVTPQSVSEIEQREKSGTVSLKVLNHVASALDMKFVYGFIPKEKSLANMVEKKAAELAKIIVERTSVQMNLEDQKNSEARIKKAINEKTEELANELPRYLWD